MTKTMAKVVEANPSPKRPSRWDGALAGVVCGGLAVTVGLFVAAVIDVVNPVNAVGGEFIDHTPAWLKTWAIDNFGTNDKRALRVGIFVVLAIIAALAGWFSLRRRRIGVAAIAAFGVIGALIAVGRPAQGFAAALPPLLGAVIGIAVFNRTLARMSPQVEMPTDGSPGASSAAGSTRSRNRSPSRCRRPPSASTSPPAPTSSLARRTSRRRRTSTASTRRCRSPR
jgi:hypothetical protein